MQVYAMLLSEGSTKPKPDEYGQMVVENLGRSLASYYSNGRFRSTTCMQHTYTTQLPGETCEVNLTGVPHPVAISHKVAADISILAMVCKLLQCPCVL